VTGKLVWSFPYTRRETRENARGISLLSLSGKVYAKCLERCREIIEPKLDDTQCCFCPAVALKTKFSLSDKSEKSWEYAKNVYRCLSTPRK